MAERGLRYRTPNGTKRITMDSNIDFYGSYDLTFTITAATNVTVPTTGTLSTLAGAETLTNKTLTQPKLSTSTPASAAATGVTGTVVWDGGFIYVCTATNTWKRVAIATW